MGCGWDTEILGQGGRVRQERKMKPCPEGSAGRWGEVLTDRVSSGPVTPATVQGQWSLDYCYCQGEPSQLFHIGAMLIFSKPVALPDSFLKIQTHLLAAKNRLGVCETESRLTLEV